MLKLNTISFPVLYDDLVETQSWFESLEISTKETRLERILEYVRIAAEHWDEGTLGEILEQYGSQNIEISILDAEVFVRIHRQFQTLKSHRLPRRKLRLILDGELLPSDDDISGGAGSRNYLFELGLAARLMSKGLSIKEWDDIQFGFEDYDFRIECKRLGSSRNIGHNITDASATLSKKMVKDRDMGIIALAIERIANTDRDWETSVIL